MPSFASIMKGGAVIAPLIALVKEALEAAGVDAARIQEILRDLAERVKRDRPGSAHQQPEDGVWEYGTVTLVEKKVSRRTRILVVKFRDGAEIPESDLTGYLNQASKDGWEVLSTIGPDASPTLVLVRIKSS